MSRCLVQSHISYSSVVLHSSYYRSLTSASCFMSKTWLHAWNTFNPPTGPLGIGGLQKWDLIEDKTDVMYKQEDS